MRRARSVRGCRACHDASAAPLVSRASASDGAEADHSRLGSSSSSSSPSPPPSPPPPPLRSALLLLLYHLPLPPPHPRYCSSTSLLFLLFNAPPFSRLLKLSSATSVTLTVSTSQVEMCLMSAPEMRLQRCPSAQHHFNRLLHKRGKNPLTRSSSTGIHMEWDPVSAPAGGRQSINLPPWPAAVSRTLLPSRGNC